MKIQNYLIIENNVITNAILWDGDFNTWTPPTDSIQLVQEITPAMMWTELTETTPAILKEFIGLGQIGFTWDGTVLTTNEPQPIYVPMPPQPIATGTQTLGKGA